MRTWDLWICDQIQYVKDLINDDGIAKSDVQLYDTITNKLNVLQIIYPVKNYVITRLEHTM